jgi:two-component system heavy metal sensor histidine kinase CusS
MRLVRDVRTRLLLVVLAAIAITLVVGTIGFNLLLARTSDQNANSLLRQRAATERELVRIANGSVRLVEASDDPIGDSRIWVYSGDKIVEAPRSRASTTAAATSLASGPSRFLNIGGSDERLFSLPIVEGGRRYGTVVVGTSLSPYEQTRRSALIASLAFAAVLLAISGGAAAWVLRSALRPVALMTAQAEAWSEQDLDKRFEQGEPHDELSRLAFTLDRLLDRIAASLRHERRFSAELSHELRTPLSKLTAEADLALRRPRAAAEYQSAIREILANAQQLARIVDTLLAAAQQEAGPHGVADATDVAQAAVDASAHVAGERKIEVSLAEPARPLRVGVDVDLAERILHPVLDNACRYGRSRVDLSIARADGSVLFTVEDDGPGVAADEAEAIFEPATRGTAGLAAGPSAGLGLALARRLARSVSGDVETAPSERGGRFVVRLPTA